MYNYVAVTNGKIINSSEVLRIDESGVIEQYDIAMKDWRNADGGMSGIYCGEIESEPITKAQADEIIQMWHKNVV